MNKRSGHVPFIKESAADARLDSGTKKTPALLHQILLIWPPMNLSHLLTRNLLLFGYVLAFWLLLIILDVTLQFNGVIAGLLYWVSLVILFMALWYVNLPAVRTIENDLLRFAGIVLLTTLITIIFMFFGIALSAQFKSLIGG